MLVIRLAHVSHTRQLSSDNSGQPVSPVSSDPSERARHTGVTETSGCFANSRASQSMNTRTRSESCRRCG